MLAFVENNGRQIVAYDKYSEQISKMWVPEECEILGIGLDFFVVRDRRYIRAFDENCREISKIMASTSDYDSVTVAGQTFTVLDGRYAVTYDPYCKVISKRRL